MDEKTKRKIERYLSLDEEGLFALIPPHLTEHEHTLFAPTGQEDAGKGYFESKVGELRKAVCEDFDWPSKRSDTSFNDTVTLVAAIADAISSVVVGVPPFIIASLLVKRGLDYFCGCN